MQLSEQLATALDEMSARQLRKILRKEGCVELRQKGSHLQVRCGNCRGTVPVHGNRDIKKGTLGAIERSLEICLGDDWIDAEEAVLGPALDTLLGEAKLPDDPWRYFTKPAGAKLVALKDLRPTRARASGIQHANKHMRNAYDGEAGKREPISLRKEKDGTYTILDGNSTYANAKANGWASIPAMVEGG